MNRFASVLTMNIAPMRRALWSATAGTVKPADFPAAHCRRLAGVARAFRCCFAARGAALGKAASLTVALAAIRRFHKAAGIPSPTEHDAVKAIMCSIRRTVGTAPTQKQPATAERMSAMLAHMASDMQGKRDRALILLGMAGAFRRSELVAFNVADLTFTEMGLDLDTSKNLPISAYF